MEPGHFPPLYGLDIETDTATDGLDPSVGRVLAVAIAAVDRVEVLDDADEAVLLDRLDRYLADLPAGALITWNGARFDLPYLATRAAIVGIPLGLRLTLDPRLAGRHDPLPGHAGAYRARWHHHDHLDAYRLYRADVGPALRVPCSLKAIAALAGLEPVEVDASRVHELTPLQMSAYVGSDARCTVELARRRWPTARLALDRRAIADLSVTQPAVIRSAVTGSALVEVLP
jgi:hypothetical protein